MALFMEVRHFAQLVAYDEQAMIIFMVYYPLGSLQSWLSHNEVNVKLAFYIIHGSFAAIYHLHKLGLVHNDIKSGNILLLEENGLVIPKLTDFGVSNVVEMKVIKVQAFKVRNARGISVAYAAPERLDIKLINNAIHARKAIEVAKNADLYSMAIVISEILLHGFPWSYI